MTESCPDCHRLTLPIPVTRSLVEHQIRMMPLHKHEPNSKPRQTHRFVREHNAVVDDLTDSERRLYATLLCAMQLPPNTPQSEMFLRHTYPGIWGLRLAVRLAKSMSTTILPYVVCQPAMMTQTVAQLGGESHLDAAIDEDKSIHWESSPFAGTNEGQKPEVFPDAQQILRTHGDSMLHTLAADMENYVRLWTEMQVVLSNLKIKQTFVQHHDLHVTSGSLYVSEDKRYQPFQQSLPEWVRTTSALMAALPAPICLHVPIQHSIKRHELRMANGNIDPKGGYPGMLGPAAGAKQGLPSLWHLSRLSRQGLASAGVLVPSESAKVLCEGCGGKCC